MGFLKVLAVLLLLGVPCAAVVGVVMNYQKNYLWGIATGVAGYLAFEQFVLVIYYLRQCRKNKKASKITINFGKNCLTTPPPPGAGLRFLEPAKRRHFVCIHANMPMC